MTTPDEYEHVTKYFYDHPNEFKIKNFRNNRNLSNFRLVLDTMEDLKRLEDIIGNMTKSHTEYSLDDLIQLYPST